MTMTGIAVKRLKKETPPSKSGSHLGVCVSPWMRAVMAITVHIPTNTNASRTDIAELNHSDSANAYINSVKSRSNKVVFGSLHKIIVRYNIE